MNGEVKFLCVKKMGGGGGVRSGGGGWGSGPGGRVVGVRVDVNEEFCEDSKKKIEGDLGGRGSGWGGQGRCERRSEVFVKIKKKIFFFLGGGGGGGGGGRVGGWFGLGVNEELKFL